MQNFVVDDEPVPAPLIPLDSSGGGERTLADFSGKVMLVNFWATWCGPRIRELPSIERLQARLGGDTFTVARISQNKSSWKVVKRFLKQMGMSGQKDGFSTQSSSSRVRWACADFPERWLAFPRCG